MKKQIAIVLATVALLGFGCSGQPTTPAVTTGATTTPSKPTTSSQPVTLGWEQQEAQTTNGPWTRDLMIAASSDGTTFSTPETFVERAGVPSVIREADGRLVAAFQWFPQDDAAFDKVAVAFSDDEGVTWTDPETIVVEGLPDGYQRPFDPTVTVTEDGRIRLFFTTTVGRPGPNADMHIASAISDDGVTYVVEPGERIIEEGERFYDAAAIRFGGVWHLTTPLHAIGASHATSEDGVTFTRLDNISSTPWNWTGNLVEIDGKMRFYGGGPGNAWWSESADGTSWSTPTRTNTPGGDPAVVQLEDGTYRMIFVSGAVR